jgi:hypothetical protein
MRKECVTSDELATGRRNIGAIARRGQTDATGRASVAILDNQHEPIEWISASRRKREMYTIKGSNGELNFKVGQSDFPAKLFTVEHTPPSPVVAGLTASIIPPSVLPSSLRGM